MDKLKTFAALTALLIGNAATAGAADIKYVKPSSTVPANGQEIASSVGVDQIVVTIPGGGEFGIETINRHTIISISLDGEPYANISTSDEAKVKFGSGSPNELAICPAQPINKPGTYTISLPANLVTMAIDAGVVDPDASEDEDPPTTVNAAYSFDFTIVDFPSYEISPKPGLYQPSDLSTFTLTFPEGSVASAGSSPQTVALIAYDLYTNQLIRQITYSLNPQGNKMVMKANNLSDIKALTASKSREWYYINIPKNVINVTIDGKVMSNPALMFEKYDVRTVGEDGFTLSPAPSEGLLPTDVREFTLSYPAKYTLDAKGAGLVGGVAAYLRQTGNSPEDKLKYSGFSYGTLIITDIDEINHVMTMKMAEPASPMAYVDNPDKMETSYYCVSLNSRVLVGKSMLNFPGYHVTGINGCPIDGARVIVNGEAQTKLELDRNQGFSGVEIFFPFNMKIVDRSKSMTLTHNGVAAATYAGSKISLPSNGDKYMMINFGKEFKTSGDYVLNIPAGMFRQTSFGDYTNIEENIKIVIPSATTAIDAIEDAEADLPTAYYTLDGRKVSEKNLLPGIYVKVQGSKATKVKI